ncbi:MAG: LacI family DNA-binding transcriptional regulator [Actinomycetes bacterium]
MLLADAAFRVLGDLVDVVLADDETRERVFRGAAELGYRPDTAAQVLRRTRSRHLGVLFSLQQPYEVDLAEAIYPAAERRGYHVVLGAMTAGRDERQAVEEPLSFRSEAIILIAPTSGRQQLARLGQQIPLIEIGRRLTGGGGVGVDVVRVADERGAQQAVDHLVALGHRDIVHRHHLQDHIRILPGDYTEESGAQAAGTLLQADKPPSAIFAANDRCAHGVIATLSRAGLDIPNDVSVVGYDDSRIARLSFVDLTTIRQDATQMAELAVEAAAQRLDEGRTTARDIVVKPTLIVRGSTGPARP